MTYVNITYFVHGTTTDNEAHISTGWKPGELSDLGKRQSVELKETIKGRHFDIVYTSDLKRAIESADIVFEEGIEKRQDKRLRECNYGDLNGASTKVVNAKAGGCIDTAFLNGESLKDVEKRIREFLTRLLENHKGKKVAIMAHKWPQLAIEVVVNKKSWPEAIADDWRAKKPKAWKPGWDYRYEQ